ncbi:MAG: HAD family phosphatase [Thermoproteota archaeon]|nr:HAD family phosphatase [Thermoproteota archaeon]
METADKFIEMKSKNKLAAFDMDGTLIDGRLIEALSSKFGLYGQVKQIQADESIPGHTKTRKIAYLLKGIEEKEIVLALESIPLMKNCQEIILALKKDGFKIGIITDSYSIAAKTLMNKLGIDFFAANNLISSNGLITGEVSMPLGWEKINCSCMISVCKRYHLEMYARNYGINIKDTVAIGDSRGDVCMVKHAGVGISFMPKDNYINFNKNIINRPDLMDVLDFIK